MLTPNIGDKLFLQFTNLAFLAPLAADMVQDDPSARPTSGQVIDRFAALRSKLGWWKLRERPRHGPESEGPPLWEDDYCHPLWTACQIAMFRPAVPRQ